MTPIKGALSLVFTLFNFIFHALMVLIGAFFLLFIPNKRWRNAYQSHFLQRIPECFWIITGKILEMNSPGKWDVSGTGQLRKDGWYILISNHQSWNDILILSKLFAKKISPLKFFMKKELILQLPIGGLACYALHYPFMSRHSASAIRKNPALKGKDIATTIKACQRLRDFPATLINFIEGTRFTEKKHARQQSPYRHLLKPHAGGTAVAIHELQDIAAGIINVTVYYSSKVPGFWNLFCGNFQKIRVHYEVIPITNDLVGNYHEDRQFRAKMQQWFNALWGKKDALIEQWKSQQ